MIQVNRCHCFAAFAAAMNSRAKAPRRKGQTGKLPMGCRSAFLGELCALAPLRETVSADLRTRGSKQKRQDERNARPADLRASRPARKCLGGTSKVVRDWCRRRRSVSRASQDRRLDACPSEVSVIVSRKSAFLADTKRLAIPIHQAAKAGRPRAPRNSSTNQALACVAASRRRASRSRPDAASRHDGRSSPTDTAYADTLSYQQHAIVRGCLTVSSKFFRAPYFVAN